MLTASIENTRLRILHVILTRGPFPATKYGGTERVVWYLAREQEKAGHEVRFLMRKHAVRPPNCVWYDKHKPFSEQIDEWPELVHFHCEYQDELHAPYVCTQHVNADEPRSYGRNSIFISKQHAENHHGECYVYNGLDWDDYGEPNLDKPLDYAHFLGKATARLKNLKGAAYVAKQANRRLYVLGGKRFELSKKGYVNFDRNLRFCGMVGGEEKVELMRNACAQLFPVRWPEPFGLAVIESLYLGTPVIASPFGSLPELLKHEEVGLAIDRYDEMIDALRNVQQFDRKRCHEYARDTYNSAAMARDYQACYERVMNGEALNPAEPYADRNLHEPLPIR